MRNAFAAAFALCLAGAITMISAAVASAQSCDQLWYERNAIYKNAGYCFKTARAIQAFGNAGCRYDVEARLPLTHEQERRIAAIANEERERRCPQ
jgi:hypothetical protein